MRMFVYAELSATVSGVVGGAYGLEIAVDDIHRM